LGPARGQLDFVDTARQTVIASVATQRINAILGRSFDAVVRLSVPNFLTHAGTLAPSLVEIRFV